MPAALDPDVFHRQWARAALLHRAVLATRLRELYARRRHPADAARDLDRACLSRLPQGAQIQRAAGSLRQLRLARALVARVVERQVFGRIVRSCSPLIPAKVGTNNPSPLSFRRLMKPSRSPPSLLKCRAPLSIASLWTLVAAAMARRNARAMPAPKWLRSAVAMAWHV